MLYFHTSVICIEIWLTLCNTQEVFFFLFSMTWKVIAQHEFCCNLRRSSITKKDGGTKVMFINKLVIWKFYFWRDSTDHHSIMTFLFFCQKNFKKKKSWLGAGRVGFKILREPNAFGPPFSISLNVVYILKQNWRWVITSYVSELLNINSSEFNHLMHSYYIRRSKSDGLSKISNDKMVAWFNDLTSPSLNHDLFFFILHFWPLFY
jgi:hypothetical protein